MPTLPTAAAQVTGSKAEWEEVAGYFSASKQPYTTYVMSVVAAVTRAAAQGGGAAPMPKQYMEWTTARRYSEYSTLKSEVGTGSGRE